MKKQEDIEILESVLKAVYDKYGYDLLEVSFTTHPESIGWDVPAQWSVLIAYPDVMHKGYGSTLREALSAASVNALNDKAQA